MPCLDYHGSLAHKHRAETSLLESASQMKAQLLYPEL